jgi:hypothetical protein
MAEENYKRVIPAKAGIQGFKGFPVILDSRFRGNDEGVFLKLLFIDHPFPGLRLHR